MLEDIKLKSLNIIVTEPPIIVGFKDINEVAEYLSLVSHPSLLDGYLLYAFIGPTEDVRSVILTTGYKYGKVMLSEVYDNYRMIFTEMNYDSLPEYINSYKSGKKNKSLIESLNNRFYDNI